MTEERAEDQDEQDQQRKPAERAEHCGTPASQRGDSEHDREGLHDLTSEATASTRSDWHWPRGVRGPTCTPCPQISRRGTVLGASGCRSALLAKLRRTAL